MGAWTLQWTESDCSPRHTPAFNPNTSFPPGSKAGPLGIPTKQRETRLRGVVRLGHQSTSDLTRKNARVLYFSTTRGGLRDAAAIDTTSFSGYRACQWQRYRTVLPRGRENQRALPIRTESRSAAAYHVPTHPRGYEHVTNYLSKSVPLQNVGAP